MTPLHYLCEGGWASSVTALLKILGSNPDDLHGALSAQTTDMHLNMAVVQSGGMTPLHLAAAKVVYKIINSALKRLFFGFFES